MPEAEAIRRAQRGDAEAFERLYRLHSRRVYSVILRMVGNTAEAEDLTQDAFLQLFRKNSPPGRVPPSPPCLPMMKVSDFGMPAASYA